ncbi:hypothetical protein HMPREF1992_01948 [Selenomonas sp. oral taxon 892 str. F0426]|nr:hypothetical protein HMPREF1992_01948 [Selenomonas sp. oral taxon 892 str. F0426]
MTGRGAERRCGRKMRQPEEDGRRGAYRTHIGDRFPTSGVVACALQYAEVVSQRFEGKFRISC